MRLCPGCEAGAHDRHQPLFEGRSQHFAEECECEPCRTFAALERAAAELNARVASCFERVDCPRCGALVGEACRRMIGGVGHRRRHNKHPHTERIRADGIPLR